MSKIEDYNKHLLNLNETNGINIIKTVPSFRLGTGELDELCFDLKHDSHSLLNRLGVIKLMGIIEKQCPTFNLCPNWEQVKRNSNNNVPQNIKRQEINTNNVTLAPKAPAPGDGVFGPVADTLRTASRVHNTTRRGNYYARDFQTKQAFHHTNTASPVAPPHASVAPAPCFPSHLATATPAIRGKETAGWGRTGGERTPTYATALGRHQTQEPFHTAHNHTHTHPSRSREWYRNSPSPVFQAKKSYTDVFIRDQNVRNRSTLINVNQANRNIKPSWSRPYHTTPSTWYNNPMIHTTSELRPYTRTQINYKRGCFNCGEFNHHQATCRFDYKMTCGLCPQLGHKQKLCQYYNA